MSRNTDEAGGGRVRVEDGMPWPVRALTPSGSLARADREWLARLITRREPPEPFTRAIQRQPDDIKVIVQFAEA